MNYIPLLSGVHHSDLIFFIYYEMIPIIRLVTICHHTKLLQVSLTVFPMLYVLSPRLIYFVRRIWYLLILFNYFTYPLIPPASGNQKFVPCYLWVFLFCYVCSLVARFHFLFYGWVTFQCVCLSVCLCLSTTSALSVHLSPDT